MATVAEYAAVSAALQKIVQGDINQQVPAMWRGMIPAHLASDLATQCAKSAVDTLDAFRAKQASANKGASS